MNTIQLQQEASGFTRRPSYGLGEPWDSHLDFHHHEQTKQYNTVEPCPFDEAQHGDQHPRPSSIAKLFSTGCCHNFDTGHQSNKTNRAEAREHEEEKDRDSSWQPYQLKYIQGSTSNAACNSIPQRSHKNSYEGSNLKDSHFETFEIKLNMPFDFSTAESFAKLEMGSIQGIPSIRNLQRDTDFGETKQGSSAEGNLESQSSYESEYVEFRPRRKDPSKVADKRMPLRQRVDDLRCRLSCITKIVTEMETKFECGEGDMDYQTYKARSSAAVEQKLVKPLLKAGTKKRDDIAWPPPLQEIKSAKNKKEHQFAPLLRTRAIDEYLNRRPHTCIAPAISPKTGTFSIECLLGDQVGATLDSITTRQNEQISPSRNWTSNTPEELIRRESLLVSPPKRTPSTGYTLERKMGSGPVASDQSLFGCLAIEVWANQAFDDLKEEWNDLPYAGGGWQQQSVQEAPCGDYEKSATGKESSPPTQPGTPTSATSATSTESKQEINSLTHDWGFPEGNASLAEGSESSSRCLRFPSHIVFKHRVRALQCILLNKLACQKHTKQDDEDIPSGDGSMAETDLEDDAPLRGVAFLEE